MAGYIGARSVSLSTTVANAQDVTATDTTPEVTIINNTHEDTDGGREGKVIFKGQQSGGEESTLAEIRAAHDGSSDDEKGKISFKTNDGNDSNSPTERWLITSEGHFKAAANGYGIDFLLLKEVVQLQMALFLMIMKKELGHQFLKMEVQVELLWLFTVVHILTLK